jgi:hypothetical protein
VSFVTVAPLFTYTFSLISALFLTHKLGSPSFTTSQILAVVYVMVLGTGTLAIVIKLMQEIDKRSLLALVVHLTGIYVSLGSFGFGFIIREWTSPATDQFVSPIIFCLWGTGDFLGARILFGIAIVKAYRLQ